jgi:hypothetical protein
MDGSIQFLLSEVAKPIDQIQRTEVLNRISSLDARDLDNAPLIFFVLENLFNFVIQSHSTLSLKDLLRRVLENPTLLPVVYQIQLPAPGSDVELNQMISFVNSFQSSS